VGGYSRNRKAKIPGREGRGDVVQPWGLAPLSEKIRGWGKNET